MYVYSTDVKQVFTLTEVRKWFRYYDMKTFNRYAYILTLRGFVLLDHTKGNFKYYRLSPDVSNIMKELSDSYNIVLSDIVKSL